MFNQLPILKREGNRTTYGQFIFVSERGVAVVDQMTVEYPESDSFQLETFTDANGIKVTTSVKIPRIVDIRFASGNP